MNTGKVHITKQAGSGLTFILALTSPFGLVPRKTLAEDWVMYLRPHFSQFSFLVSGTSNYTSLACQEAF